MMFKGGELRVRMISRGHNMNSPGASQLLHARFTKVTSLPWPILATWLMSEVGETEAA